MDTVADMTATVPYMEQDMQELAEQTAAKLNELTKEESAGIVFEPAEDIE